MDGGRSAYWIRNERKRGGWANSHHRPRGHRPHDRAGHRPRRRAWTSNNNSAYTLNQSQCSDGDGIYYKNPRHRVTCHWSGDEGHQESYSAPPGGEKGRRHDYNFNYYYKKPEDRSPRRWRDEFPRNGHDTGFRRPREPRSGDYHHDRRPFRRTNSYDPTCRATDGSYDRSYRTHSRRDSDSSLTSPSGIDWDSSRTETPRISSRDPRLSRGQDYKIKLGTNSTDSGVDHTDPISERTCSVSVLPAVETTTPSSLSSNKPDSRSYSHSSIMSSYDEMCANVKRTTEMFKHPGKNDDDSSKVDHELDNSVKPSCSESSAVCSTNVPADSHRKVLAPKPSNILTSTDKNKSIVSYRASIAAQDTSYSLTTDLSEDLVLRKEVTAAEPKSILKKSAEQQRSSKSSLASLTRKLPSNVCLNNCSKPKKKQSKIMFNMTACVPGKRRTWNSLSSNYDTAGRKVNMKRSPRKVESRMSSTAGGGAGVAGVSGQAEVVDKKQEKRKLFLSTFGEPVDMVKDTTGASRGKKTDKDAASALLLLSEHDHHDMPKLSPMCQHQRRSSVDSPPVLSPQSSHDTDQDITEIQCSIKQEHEQITTIKQENIDTGVLNNDLEKREVLNNDLEKTEVLNNDLEKFQNGSKVTSVIDVKSKRARRTTLGGDEIQKGVDEVLKSGVNSAIATNACYVKLCRIEEGSEGLVKQELEDECETTLLSGDVARSDGNDLVEEAKTTDVVKSILQVKEEHNPVVVKEEKKKETEDVEDDGECVVRRSKKRASVNKGTIDTCPSPPKILRSENVRFQQPVKCEFEKIERFLQDCHRQITPKSEQERSLFSSILSDSEKVVDMNDSALPDLVKSDESVQKPIKVDMAKLKSILSPHRIKKQGKVMNKMKRSHSEVCMDIFRDSVRKLEMIRDEIRNGSVTDKNRSSSSVVVGKTDSNENLKVVSKRVKKVKKCSSVDSAVPLPPDDLPTITVKKIKRQRSGVRKKPSVMVSLPLESMNPDQNHSAVKNETLKAVESVMSPDISKTNASVLLGTETASGVASVVMKSDVEGVETNDSVASVVTDQASTPGNVLDTHEQELAVNALLSSQQQIQSPAYQCRDTTGSSVLSSPKSLRSPKTVESVSSVESHGAEKETPQIQSKEPGGRGPGIPRSEAKPRDLMTSAVSSDANIPGVVLSLSEERERSARDALSDALTSSGLGTLVQKPLTEHQRVTDPTSNPDHGLETRTRPVHGPQTAKSRSSGQVQIAGPPVPFHMLMPGHAPMMPVYYPAPRMPDLEVRYPHPVPTAAHGNAPFRPHSCRSSVPNRIRPPGSQEQRYSRHSVAAAHRQQAETAAFSPPRSAGSGLPRHEPRFTSPPRPVLMSPPGYSPRNRVHRPLGGPGAADPRPMPPRAPPALHYGPQRQLTPQRSRFLTHPQRPALWRPEHRPRHHAPPCQQITVDLHPRRETSLSGPLETVTYSDGVDVISDPCSASNPDKMLTVTIDNSLADSSFPASDSSFNESDISGHRPAVVGPAEAGDALQIQGKVSSTIQEPDTASGTGPKARKKFTKKPSAMVVEEIMRKVLESTPVDERVKKSEIMNVKQVSGRQADSTVDEWPTSTSDVPSSKPDSQVDGCPYIPKLHLQSEPLDLTVRQEKLKPVKGVQKPRTSEEFYVGFPLRAQPTNETTDNSCVLSCDKSEDCGMVPLVKIANHQPPTGKTVRYPVEKEAPPPDRVQNMPPLIPGGKPNGTVLDLVKEAENDHSMLERQMSFDRRKILEENRSMMQREERPTSKEIVESRLQGVYSPLSQSTIDPHYPPVIYPSYPYGLPFVPYSVGMIPVAPVHPRPPMGFYPPAVPVQQYGPVFIPPGAVHQQQIYRPMLTEPKKRKKKPRNLPVPQKDVHPLSDVGATSEDSESQTSHPTSLKRRILDQMNGQN